MTVVMGLHFDLPGEGVYSPPLDEDDLSNLHYIASVYLKPIAEACDPLHCFLRAKAATAFSAS